MANIQAFAPANISLIFTIEEHPDPTKTGSKGVGFTVNKGVKADVYRSKHSSSSDKQYKIFFNNKLVNLPTVIELLELLEIPSVEIKLKSSLPLGYGFGLSGASALAVAFAVNKLFDKDKSDRQLAKSAHLAEVICRTGLGDVVNQFYGGFCLKWQPSSSFKVIKLRFTGRKVYYKFFKPLATKSVLNDGECIKRINFYGCVAINQLKDLIKRSKEIDLSDILNISLTFAKKSKLLQDKDTRAAIEAVRSAKGAASMIMLGNGLVADRPFRGCSHLDIDNKAAGLI